MSQIFWYNPENDIALARNCVACTPDVHAAQIHYAGSFLPFWLASGSADRVVVSDQDIADASEYCHRFGLSATPVAAAKGALSSEFDSGEMNCSPWGWSRATVTSLRNFGVPRTSLPTAEQIDSLRLLSSRRTAVEVNRLVSTDAATAPRELFDMESVAVSIESEPDCVVKFPWSSSGRGVFMAGALPFRRLMDVAAGSIRRQGSVFVERRLDKILDFAALFKMECSEGGLYPVYKGYSVFVSDHGGNYGGNLVDSQEALRKLIESHLPPGYPLDSVVCDVGEALVRLLGPVADFYNGWIGVDMMVYRTGDGSTAVAPCVEVNLRTTMGVVAMAVAERLASDKPMLLRSVDMSHCRSDRSSEAISLSPSNCNSSVRFELVEYPCQSS